MNRAWINKYINEIAGGLDPVQLNTAGAAHHQANNGSYIPAIGDEVLTRKGEQGIVSDINNSDVAVEFPDGETGVYDVAEISPAM